MFNVKYSLMFLYSLADVERSKGFQTSYTNYEYDIPFLNLNPSPFKERLTFVETQVSQDTSI